MAEPIRSESAWQTRELANEDAVAMRALFAEVFNKPMSEALWRWKYANESGHGTGVWKDGELVAHYGGMGRDILYFGERQRAVQITDVMVKTAGRNAVRRGSPFYLAGKAFLETWIGYGQPYLLGFGFPSDRHMALARHLGLYAPVGRMIETLWESGSAKPSPWVSVQAVGGSSSSGSSGGSGYPAYSKIAAPADTLWQSMSKDLTNNIVATKPASFLRTRYLHHPEHKYQVHLVRNRLTRKALGLLVLRHQDDHSLLMDVIAPFKHFPVLLRAAIALSARAGKPLLKTWCSQCFAPLFSHHGAIQQELPITTPTNILTPAPQPEALKDKWWLMPGDTDFL